MVKKTTDRKVAAVKRSVESGPVELLDAQLDSAAGAGGARVKSSRSRSGQRDAILDNLNDDLRDVLD